MQERVELRVERNGDRTVLKSPGVGRLSCIKRGGEVLVPEQVVGVLTTLGRSVEIVTPAGVSGRIVSEDDGLARRPVGFGDVVYELETVSGELARADSASDTSSETDGALVVRASQSGRFYRRPGPGEPTFVEVGTVIEDGATIGLIEIMKTFNHVHYRATESLPASARVTRVIAPDGADVSKGDALLEIEAD